jgi:Ca2+-binding RTX toxin-like protein
VQNSGRIEGNVSLGSGNGVFVSAGGQVAGDIRGEAGNDRFVVDSGALVILGGSGVDTIESSVSLRNGVDVEVLLLTGSAGLQAIGRGQDETITGGAGNDTIEGRDGQDRLDGGEGDDILRGGQGNDVLLMSAGDDTLAGGAGRDLLRLDLGTGAVVSLAAGAATSRDAGGEVLRSAALAGIEDVEGSAQADAITGSGGDNLLLGNGGDDTVSGGNGNDRLDGGTGADTLVGGNGVDTLSGGTGADVLTGGAGADRFVFAEVTDSPPGAADRITDFAAATEVIDLEAIYGDENAPVDVPFTFLGTGAFTGNGPEVRYFQNGGITVLEIRYAESVINDMEIVLTGLVNLTAANFIL